MANLFLDVLDLLVSDGMLKEEEQQILHNSIESTKELMDS